MTEPRRLVLGSGSPYRAALLEHLGLSFEQRSPEIDEGRHGDESPSALVVRLAAEKARAAGAGLDDALVIGCDQLACLDGHVLGKPGDRAGAIAQLRAGSGRRVGFLVGLALLDTRTGALAERLETVDVVFRNLSAAEIERYVDRDRPWDCAGAFRAEGLGIALFEAIEGRDPNTLVGLPLIALAELLREAGVPLP
ncbi:Maf family nucleotide pyrophosphatase [Arhodomonas aquaeolei]|uniref:Maf family protein n=1 Tax=Arhodomonas aquaeolei TaxID=2369 RepID=UPI0021675192|nr:nucleoside triphosphate pyrophosphatase [Arhodomonas aquaeolei]MCS4503320.1 Maf family nucleotide pyrophosphatase [Arhodomonas aquaeolei]